MTAVGMARRGRYGTGALARRSDDALTDYEREILALWDGGQSLDRIVAVTGRAKKSVRNVIANYDDRPDIDWLDGLRDANVQFVARLRQVHGTLIGLRA